MAAPPIQGRTRQRRVPKILAAICAIGIAAVAIVIAIHPGSTSHRAARLSSHFEMHFDNLTFHIQTGGTLTNVAQDARGRITGFMTVNPPLYGTGRFTGTRVGSTIHFVGAQRGDYRGVVGATGAVHGTYSYSNQHGTWRATTTQVAVANNSGWPPWWLWLLLVVTVAGFVANVVWALRSSRRNRVG